MNPLLRATVSVLVLVLCRPAWGQRGFLVAENAAASPWTHLKLPKRGAEEFTFAILADVTGGRRAGVLDQAVRKLNLLQPDFVMSVGDLIEGYAGDPRRIAAEWDRFDEKVRRLRMPFFYLPGNHDIFDKPSARVWRKRYGRSYYHFVFRNVLFLCLNTEDGRKRHISEEQVRYVAEALKANRNVRWTFVFMHQPIWAYSRRLKTNWEKIEPLLKGRSCTVFSGHTHRYWKTRRGNHEYYILATAGGVSSLAGAGMGHFDHVTQVRMTDEGPRVTNLLLNGILDADMEPDNRKDELQRGRPAELFHIRPVVAEGPMLRVLTIPILLRNDQDVDMRLRAVFRTRPGLCAEPAKIDVTLKELSTTLIRLKLTADPPIPVRELPPVNVDWTAQYRFRARPAFRCKGTYPIVIHSAAGFECRRRDKPVVVDGRLGDWPALPFTCTDSAEIQTDLHKSKGPADRSFRFGVARDGQYLYIAVQATDDRSFLDPALEKTPWMQDGVEIRVDARPEQVRFLSRGMDKHNKAFLSLLLTPGRSPKQTVIHRRKRLPKGVKAVCLQTPGGHVTEIAIPEEYLSRKQGRPWTTVRVNVAMNDFDGPRDGGAKLWWRPDWRGTLQCPTSGTFRRQP